MTTTDGTGTRTRRSILAAAAGGAAAATAGVLAHAAPVAANGETIVVGGHYTTAARTTYLRNERNERPVFVAESTVGAGIAVEGDSRDGVGVLGWSGLGDGIRGESDDGFAISAASEHGFAIAAGTDDGVGLFSINLDGIGAFTLVDEGIGLASMAAAGYALLSAAGRVRFNDISGRAIIPAGKTSVTIQPPVPVTRDAFVLLTPRSNVGSRGLWYTTNPGKGTFSIRMSTARTARTSVAWLLLETGQFGEAAAGGVVSLDRFHALADRGRAQRRRLNRQQSRHAAS
jgi:hypothetical protein